MKLKTMDISATASASSIVFDALRKAIIEGQLEEGEPLRQDEIARLFNTSRIPVREAISRLEEQGLVKTQRYKGLSSPVCHPGKRRKSLTCARWSNRKSSATPFR